MKLEETPFQPSETVYPDFDGPLDWRIQTGPIPSHDDRLRDGSETIFVGSSKFGAIEKEASMNVCPSLRL